jgi:hypothetical protein
MVCPTARDYSILKYLSFFILKNDKYLKLDGVMYDLYKLLVMGGIN